MRFCRIAACCFASFIFIFPASAQFGKGVSWGVEAGAYFPTDAAIRDAFGRAWFSFGIKPVRISTRDNWSLIGDLAITTRSENGNKLAMIRPTFGVLKLFGDVTEPVRPYFAIRGGPAYIDYAINIGPQHFSNKRIGLDGNAELGVIFNQRFALSLRYDAMSQFDGFKFNGFTLSGSLVVAKF